MTKPKEQEKGVQFTKLELSVINEALQISPDGRARQFPIHELKQAMGISEKILKCTEPVMGEEGFVLDQAGDPLRVFIPGSVEFTSEEIVMIKKLVNDSQWDVYRGKAAIDLLSKLP